MAATKNIRWYKVFNSPDEARNRVPLNRTVRVDIDNLVLCLVHAPEGFFAVDDKCPHQGLPISRGGICENGHVVCPFHRFAWNLKTGRESRGVEANIHLYPVSLKAEGLFIGVEQTKRWWRKWL
jgi:3-phenylpropionate/trans-cinnamate dioxygenase ferredoxin subunit